MGNTQITDQQFAKFQADTRLLRRRYKYDEMAKQLKVEKGNFSSYRSGKKRPGEEFLFKFYSRFQQDLIDLDEERSGLSMVEEQWAPYGITRAQSPSSSQIDEMISKLDKIFTIATSLQEEMASLRKMMISKNKIEMKATGRQGTNPKRTPGSKKKPGG